MADMAALSSGPLPDVRSRIGSGDRNAAIAIDLESGGDHAFVAHHGGLGHHRVPVALQGGEQPLDVAVEIDALGRRKDCGTRPHSRSAGPARRLGKSAAARNLNAATCGVVLDCFLQLIVKDCRRQLQIQSIGVLLRRGFYRLELRRRGLRLLLLRRWRNWNLRLGRVWQFGRWLWRRSYRRGVGLGSGGGSTGGATRFNVFGINPKFRRGGSPGRWRFRRKQVCQLLARQFGFRLRGNVRRKNLRGENQENNQCRCVRARRACASPGPTARRAFLPAR